MKHIQIDTSICTGCNTCEAVCSLSHEGVVSPSLARLRIIDYYVEGHRIEAYVCKQCIGAECLRACRSKALYVDKKTGAKVIKPEKCTNCMLCVKACPQYPNSPIYYNANKKTYIKCDLCGGNPLCVKFCPEAALSLSEEKS